MTSWRRTTLGELELESAGVIQTGPFGSQLHASDYSTSGIPVVMPTNIRDLRISEEGIARVPAEHVERLARHKLRPGDIVYSRRGDVEKCALVTEAQSGWLCGTGCLLVRVGGDSVDPRFLAYSLSRPETRAWITAHAVGATMPNLNTDLIREVPVYLPPVHEQHQIAATLGALDDKMSVNHRIAELCRELAQSHWDGMFLAAPVSTSPLGEVATVIKGASYRRSELVKSDTCLVTLKCFGRTGRYRREGLKTFVGRYRPEQVVEPGDALVAITDLTQGAELIGRVLPGPVDHEFRALVASLDTAIVRPMSGMVTSEWLHGVLNSRSFRDHCLSQTSGTTVLHLAPDTIKTFDFPVVSMQIQQRYSQVAKVLIARIRGAEFENLLLADLRNELLEAMIMRPQE